MESSRNSTLTNDWQEYDGCYEKEMQDIRLSTGEEIMMCWPNAGVWSVCSDEGETNKKYLRQDIPNRLVTHVRKTHSKRW